jgi:ribosome maturation factor RimP
MTHLAGIPYLLKFASEKAIKEGNGVRSLLLLPYRKIMMEPLIEEIERKVNNLIAEETGLFLVDIKVKPTNNIKIYIDGDQGVSIEKLAHFNRRLYRQLEEENVFPGGDFSLELSSPGLDEPLKLHRQYLKNIGRNVEVITSDGLKKEGKLLEVSDQEILVEEQRGHGKKIELIRHNIPVDQIKSTKIQIKF